VIGDIENIVDIDIIMISKYVEVHMCMLFFLIILSQRNSIMMRLLRILKLRTLVNSKFPFTLVFKSIQNMLPS